ncbi:15813_t:CDS:2 [Funneliformis mosseae]|uniref:15813_t:CDS:1 n=1 Tax=Funneliformis mosseae TaxID=27381 RepID=A0A9N8VFF5_FUNMO|nr:15813_t:CDS:2 [Funneliformis mosseae]
MLLECVTTKTLKPFCYIIHTVNIRSAKEIQPSAVDERAVRAVFFIGDRKERYVVEKSVPLLNRIMV